MMFAAAPLTANRHLGRSNQRNLMALIGLVNGFGYITKCYCILSCQHFLGNRLEAIVWRRSFLPQAQVDKP